MALLGKIFDALRNTARKMFSSKSDEPQKSLGRDVPAKRPFIATARGNPSASALGGIATKAIDRRHENKVQYATQEAAEGTPQGENGLKYAAPNDTRFRPQGLEWQASSECQSWVGQPTCKPTGFSRGYLTESDRRDGTLLSVSLWMWDAFGVKTKMRGGVEMSSL